MVVFMNIDIYFRYFLFQSIYHRICTVLYILLYHISYNDMTINWTETLDTSLKEIYSGLWSLPTLKL